MKKLICVLLVLTLALPALALAEGSLIRIGVVCPDPAASSYWETSMRDMETTFTAENSYDAKFVRADIPGLALDLINGGAQYLLICPVGTQEWEPVLETANNRGVTVFLYDRTAGIDPELYTAAVVNDYAAQGELAVSWLESLGLERCDILYLAETPGTTEHDERSFALAAKCSLDDGWNIVAASSGMQGREEVFRLVDGTVRMEIGFNVVYAESDRLAKWAVEALDEYGIPHGTADGAAVVVSFGCDRQAMRELQAGGRNFEVQSSPFQASLIDLMIKTLEGGGSLDFLDEQKRLVSLPTGFDALYVTEDDVETYGLGE